MKNGNKPISPNPIGTLDSQRGLTKREYFAGLAMQGILSNEIYNKSPEKAELIGFYAVAHADALLKALEEKES